MSRRYMPNADWWIGRSQSKEYQKAYDEIVNRIKFSPEDVLLDVACGTGEIIRRIPLDGKILGTDNNLTMLKKAAENLKKNKIPVKVYTELLSPQEWNEEVKEKRVTLIKDNMYQSNLPNSLCDIAVHTFPEYISNEDIRFLNEINWHNATSKMGDVRDREIHRILKPNGTFYTTYYDVLPRGKKPLKLNKQYLRRSGVKNLYKIVSAEHIKDEEIARDGFSEKPKGLKRNPSYGYGIVKLRKTRI